MSRLLKFEKLSNTRDLGGMRTADGRVIRDGLLFRSGHLSSLTPADTAALADLGIRTVVDFRSGTEQDRQPDSEIPGAVNIRMPILDSLTPGVTREKESDEAVFQKLMMQPEKAFQYMCATYNGFAGETAAQRYRAFLEILMNADGPVLWHCTAGKDRAGTASVIVEEILGVPREKVIADYMATNDYLAADIARLTVMVKRQAGTDSPLADASLRYMFGADEAFIRSFYAAAEQQYGSFEGFIRDGLKVSAEEADLLRARYLC